jgi:hypothetical protein
MKLIKTELDLEDLDIVLCADLIDDQGNWYDHTLEQALEEQTKGKPLLYCEYMVELNSSVKTLSNFIGWTEDRVVFSIIGIGVRDTLLDSVLRNPPEGI